MRRTAEGSKTMIALVLLVVKIYHKIKYLAMVMRLIW